MPQTDMPQTDMPQTDVPEIDMPQIAHISPIAHMSLPALLLQRANGPFLTADQLRAKLATQRR